MNNTAIISEDNQYRYQLLRVWDETLPRILFIMLNPSTADATKDDPTIRRVISFAKSWGYGGVYVGNLFAFRSTDPKRLKYVTDPTGEDNIQHITTMFGLVDKIIYAWGNNQTEPDWLCDLVPAPYCIELSKKGVPKHPLYLKKDTQPTLFIR